MPLSIDRARITRAWVVPWETIGPEPATYGVAWVRDDGYHGADVIGSKADAQQIVDEIAEMKK